MSTRVANPSVALFSAEIETALLNRMLTQSGDECQAEIIEALDSTDFGDARHSVIFNAAADLMSQGAPVESEAVMEHLMAQGAINLAGGVQYMAALLDATPTLNPSYHVGVVKGYSLRRKLREALVKGIALTEVLERDVSEISHEVERLVMLAGERKGESDSLREMGDYFAAFMETMEKAENGLTWGLPDLDDLTRGLRRQRLYTIMARPSLGKSALVQGVALNATAHEGKRVAFFSVENGDEEWMEAAFAWAGGFDMHTFRLVLASSRPDLAQGYVEFDKAATLLKDARSRLHLDTQSRTVAQMRSRARRMKKRFGLDLIVVDHIHEMDGPEESEERKVANIARGLKALAKELDVPVLAAAQLNRECEKRPDKRPMPSDGRASGGIEEASDTIGLIYRPEFYFGPELTIPKDQGGGKKNVEGYAEWIIGKNRGGSRQHQGRDHVKLFFRAPAVRFESFANWGNR